MSQNIYKIYMPDIQARIRGYLTGSKQEKEYVKAVYCHPAYLTYMQSTSCEMPGCISNLRYADDTTLMAESEEELKSLLIKVKEESEKVG